jgi:hypothetical protein
MKKIMLLLALTMFCCPLHTQAQEAAVATKKEEAKPIKTKDVKLGDMTFKLPESWAAAKNTSRMRLATYAVKPVKGEKDAGEVTVFRFPKQPIKANIDRWIGQFEGGDKAAKIAKGTCPTGEYYVLETVGTFKKPKPGTPPFQRQTISVKDYRMLGVVLPREKDMVFVKLSGPNKTVAGQGRAFRAFFGGDLKTEKPHKF